MRRRSREATREGQRPSRVVARSGKRLYAIRLVTILSMLASLVSPAAVLVAPAALAATPSAPQTQQAAREAAGPWVVSVSDSSTRRAAMANWQHGRTTTRPATHGRTTTVRRPATGTPGTTGTTGRAPALTPTENVPAPVSAADARALSEAQANAAAQANASAQGWQLAPTPTGQGSGNSADCTTGDAAGVSVVTCPAGSGTPLSADSAPETPVGPGGALSEGQLGSASAAALADWAAADPSADVSNISFSIADLPDLRVGESSGRSVVIDVDAAGWGWGDGGMDLRTVLRHEIGHVAGLEHSGSGLMAASLSAGQSKQVPVAEPVEEPAAKAAETSGGAQAAAADEAPAPEPASAADADVASNESTSDTPAAAAEEAGQPAAAAGGVEAAPAGAAADEAPAVAHWTVEGDTATLTPAPGATLDGTVRYDSATGQLQYVAADGTVVAVDASGLTTVNVSGSSGDDRIQVDLSAGTLPATVTISGGGGSDTLVGPAAGTTWTISGVNTGSVAGVVFTGFSALQGAAGNADTFVIGSAGTITGSVDGGAGGTDAMVEPGGSGGLGSTTMSAGHLVLGGGTLAFHGFELIATGLAGAVGGTTPQTGSAGPVATGSAPPPLDVTFNLPEGLPAAAPDPSSQPGSGPSPPAQIILLVFGGALGVDYDGPISVADIDVPAFVAPTQLSGREALIIAAIKAAVERKLAGQNVIVTLDRPVAGTDYSTIYIGGTDAAFAGYGPLYALSEKVDSGNADRNDIAFVFTASLPARGKTVAAYAEVIAEYAAHEAGHLLGYEHMRTVHTHTAGDILGEVAFKPYTHVEIAKDVRNDLIEDGLLDIVSVNASGNQFTTSYSVHPRILEAIIRFPGHYYAGTVGPDGFPDVTFGQRIIHPNDTGTWLSRIFDMAWEAQSLPQFSDEEKLQILAFAYGYATHAAGDFMAHTLVNEFSEGVFPAVFDIVAGETSDRDAANAIRHLLLEAYIGDATPGADLNGDRSLLPNGDISGDQSAGIIFDAPMRFIYDALISPFPGDPTAPADTGHGKDISAVASGVGGFSYFTRSVGSFLVDNFKPGQQIFSFGFTNAANNGKFIIDDDDLTPGGLGVAVTATSIRIRQVLVTEAGTGDEALVARGDRGPVLDLFFIIQTQIDNAYQDLVDVHGAPTQTFDQILASLLPTFTAGGTPAPALMAQLTMAYLARWSDDIDAGLAEWGRFGLATTNALFDPETHRYWENRLAGNDGIDSNRGEDEAGVGLLDIVLGELDDPNRDGNYDDSFLSYTILPMLGLPRMFGDLRTAVGEFGDLIDDLVLAPVRFIFLPITVVLGAVKEVVKDLVIEAISHATGIDFELLEELAAMNNKMDLKSVEIDGTVIPIFKDGDHAKIDAYMGIQGIANSAEFTLPNVAGVEFYDDATGRLNDNVEFDKHTFKAYANAATLAKMLLLQETNPLSSTPTAGSGQLSALMGNILSVLNGTPTSYDWTKLNMVGDHGGNIYTTTLPKPERTHTVAAATVSGSADTITLGPSHGLANTQAVRYDRSGAAVPIGGLVDTGGYFVSIVNDALGIIQLHLTFEDALKHVNPVDLTAAGDGTLRTAVMADVQGSATEGAVPGLLLDLFRVARDGDTRPWLRLIDGDAIWRANNMTATRALFVIHAPGTGACTYSEIYDPDPSACPTRAPGDAAGDYVQWEATLGAGTWNIQGSWLWNVTQRLDNPLTLDINPAEVERQNQLAIDLGTTPPPLTDPIYRYWENRFGFKIDFKVDGAHLDPTDKAQYALMVGTTGDDIDVLYAPKDQRLFNSAYFDEQLGIFFDDIGQLTLTGTTTIRIRLLESQLGHVSAGPMRFVNQANPAELTRVFHVLDPNTLEVLDDNGFTVFEGTPFQETGCAACGEAGEVWALNTYDLGWLEMAYETGSGNFPLWESAKLRPVFRSLFRDWQNGGLNFPDLGDTASVDPNTNPLITPDVNPGPYLTPFTQPFPPTAPTGIALVVSGVQALTFQGTTVISSITGDGSGPVDALTITVTAVTTGPVALIDLAVDLIANAFTRTSGSFLTDGFAVGQEIRTSGFSLNNGTYRIIAVTALTLTVAESLLFGDSTGSGDEVITSAGRLIFAGDVGGNGLTGLEVLADEVLVWDGVTISTRTTSGTAPRTDVSLGHSGDVSITAPLIELRPGSAIVSFATSGFTGGDITLVATAFGDSRFDGLRLVGPQARVLLGASSLLHGALVNVTATATTAAPAQLQDIINDLLQVLPAAVGLFTAIAKIAEQLLFLPQMVRDGITVIADGLEAAEDAFRQAIGNDGVFELPSGVKAAAVMARSDADIDVRFGGQIRSTGDISLVSRAVSSVNVVTDADDGYLGLSYAMSAPTARVRLGMGSIVVAVGAVELKATTDNTLDLRTEVSNDGDVVGVSASFAKTESLSRVEALAGSQITAASLSLIAENVRSISNVAVGSGFADSDDAGVGAVLAVGYYVSSAEAVLAARVTTTGDVLLDTRSSETKNDTQASGSVSAPVGTGSGIENAANETAGDVPTDANADGRDVDPNGDDPLTIGAAMSLVESENKAASWLDDGAFLTVGGSLRIVSHAESRPRATAVATTIGAPGGTAIGGALVWAIFGNQATSFVGFNGIADVAHALELDATATFAAPYPLTDPSLDPNVTLSDLGDTYTEANTAGSRVSSAFDAVVAGLTTQLGDPSMVGTTYAHAASGGGAETALSGGVNVLEIYSAAATGFAPGSRVNQRGLTPASDQDVVTNAVSSVETVNVSGLESALSLPTGGVATPASTAGGGYFGGTFIENYARAYVDDRAWVAAARDIKLQARTESKVLNLAKQGATGTGTTIEGVFGVVVLDHESLAFVEDRARVASGGDLELAARNGNRVVNIAGASALGGSDVVGIAVAATIIGSADHILGSPEALEDRSELDEEGELVGGSSVRAFIGDARQSFGEFGTGGETGRVSAGGALKLTAENDASLNELWTLAVSGAGSAATPAGSTDLSSAEDSANDSRLDLSAAGSGAINVLNRRTLVFVRDVPSFTEGIVTVRGVVVGGGVELTATDAAFLVASAGAKIGTANDTIGAAVAINASDIVAHAYLDNLSLSSAGLTLIAGADTTLLSFESTALTGGGSGLAIAVSFDLTLADSDVRSWVGADTDALTTGDVLMRATSKLDVIADAGTAAFETGGGFSVGAALTLVIINSDAAAFPEIDIDTDGDVTISSTSDVRNRAFSAVNGSTASSAATTAPAGQIVVVIIGSHADSPVVGVAVSGADVSISATNATRSVAEAIGDSSHANGSKDAAIATSFVTGTAIAHVSGDQALTATGILTISAANTGAVTTRGDAGAAQAGAGIAVAIVNFATKAFIDSTDEVTAASLLVSADSSDTVTTSGSASQGGAEANDESVSARTQGNAQDSEGSAARAGRRPGVHLPGQRHHGVRRRSFPDHADHHR